MYKALARTPERGQFDIIFMADGYSIKDDGLGPDALRSMTLECAPQVDRMRQLD